jgi:hypothetical protein
MPARASVGAQYVGERDLRSPDPVDELAAETYDINSFLVLRIPLVVIRSPPTRIKRLPDELVVRLDV